MVTNPRIEGLTDWRPLARGGFAIVWQARQESLNRLVAVKVDERKLDNPAERERFLREAGAAGRMSGHPGIVTVHDAGLLPDDRPYLVMELCTGGSLTRFLQPENRPSQEWVREIGIRIADALAAAHAQGVLHRDVKPANVLIDQYGHAGLADFGLAVLPDPGMELAETLEALTPAYAPPEAFVPHSPTQRGDVYSLAATLYALLGGHPPRAGGEDTSHVDTALARLDYPVERLPGVDPGLMDVVMRALADDPAARPTAAEFRDALAALPLGAPAEVALQPELDEPRSRVAVGRDQPGASAAPVGEHLGPRRRWVVPLAVAAALVAIVGGGLALTSGGRGVSSRPASPAPVTTASAPSTTPTSTSPALPAGFVDCSDQVAPGVLCGPVPPQCWGGLNSVANAPFVATPAGCRENHVYQTFAAGPLAYAVRRQPQLENDPAVKAVCTQDLVNSMLDPGDRREDWEVFVIPPQTNHPGDTYYRCVFGRGERTRPLELSQPG